MGVAWEAGVLAGLLEAGLEVGRADLVLGTSAGSIVGTWLAGGRPADLLAAAGVGTTRAADPGRAEATRRASAISREMVQIFTTWARSAGFTPELGRQIGRLALAAPALPEADFLAWIARELDTETWPGRLRTTAVDAESGEPRTFSAADGVPLVDAVAASCAVPGVFAPVTVGGRRYLDGGLRSATSADLLAPFRPDAVLVVAPLCAAVAGLGPLAQRDLESEVATLRRSGADVAVLTPSPKDVEVFGGNLMDAARTETAAVLGRERAGDAASSRALSAWRR